MSDTDQTNGTIHPKVRDDKGRFAEGNPGGPGGSRPGSGRKPKPKNPQLLSQLYDLLDQAAPEALETVRNLLQSKDEKVRLKAGEIILSKTLPTTSRLETTLETQSSDQPVLSPQLAAIFSPESMRKLCASNDDEIENGWENFENDGD
jgi:hypothetical protein